jgi:hypothetical protein
LSSDIALRRVVFGFGGDFMASLSAAGRAVNRPKEGGNRPKGAFSLDFRGPIGYTIFYSRDVRLERPHLSSLQEAFRVKWS